MRPILAVLFLAACGGSPYVLPEDDVEQPDDTNDLGDVDPVDPEEDDPADTAPEPSFTADEGDWVTVTETMLHDDCQMADYVTDGPGGVVEVLGAGIEEFSITHTRGTELCVAADDGSFECDTRSRVDSTPRQKYGMDADLVMDITPSGAFYDDENMVWESYIDVECMGSGCWLVTLATSSFPCSMSIRVEAESM